MLSRPTTIAERRVTASTRALLLAYERQTRRQDVHRSKTAMPAMSAGSRSKRRNEPEQEDSNQPMH